MKTSTLLLGLSAAVAIFSLGAAWISERTASHELRKAHQESRVALQALQAGLSASESRLAHTVAMLAARDEELNAMKSRLAGLEQAAAEARRAAEAITPAPYPVRTYLGSDFIGFAWVKPANIVRDARTGRVTFDPVLVLDENFRRAVSGPGSESAPQREIIRYETVNYTCYPSPIWFVPPVYCPVPPKNESAAPPTAPTRPPDGGSPWMPAAQTAPRYTPSLSPLITTGTTIQRPIVSPARTVPPRAGAFVPSIRQTQIPSTVR
jgi:hypothetical protein